MQFMEGTPILKLGEEMAKRGINPSGAMARLTKRYARIPKHHEINKSL
jgi:hypothetical protein